MRTASGGALGLGRLGVEVGWGVQQPVVIRRGGTQDGGSPGVDSETVIKQGGQHSPSLNLNKETQSPRRDVWEEGVGPAIRELKDPGPRLCPVGWPDTPVPISVPHLMSLWTQHFLC